jgi:hypothetical protein
MRQLTLNGRGSPGVWTVFMVALAATATAQPPAPLSNADVIDMVKAGLPESTIVNAIRSGPAHFDTSAAALIALHQAGVSSSELDAITSSGQRAAGNGAGAPVPSDGAGPRWRLPSAALLKGGSTQELPLEKAQLAQTKTKPTSMSALASDPVTTQAMQSGIGIATNQIAGQMNYGVGSGVVQGAGAILSTMLSTHKNTVTYVWGVVGPTSATMLHTTLPTFAVNFVQTPGVNPAEYAPQIVKLTPAQNTCRILGATEGKEDARSTPAADWQMYSGFVEERAAVTSRELRPGEYEVTPSSPLLPGEYALVLRPLSRNKKFSGADVARGQGDGQMFQVVFTFSVPIDAT